MKILEISGLTKLYNNGRGAEDISFALAPGDVMGLLGPNGSGKTTTMKAIVGLLYPQQGAISVCGIDAIAEHERAMANVGCLIEAPALYDFLTATQNLRLFARFYPNVDEARIQEVLRLVEMERYTKDKVRTYSLGMRQRVGLAAALLSRPRLLILDEPANGLDIEGMIYVRDVVRTAAEDGSTVLISSHLAGEIQQYATRAAVRHNGRLLATDTLSNILTNHETLENYLVTQVQNYRKNQ